MNRSIIIIFLIFLFSNCAFSQLNGPNRAQTISNIFQIPIQTLTAISNVAQNTRPIGQIISQRRRPFQQGGVQGGGFPQQTFSPQIFPQQNFSPQTFRPQTFRPQTFPQQNFSPQTFPQSNYYDRFGNYISKAARIAGLYTALDGSGFRI